jgi:hypothetical protein
MLDRIARASAAMLWIFLSSSAPLAAATLYTVTDLGDLPDSGWTIIDAIAVNDLGQIVVDGRHPTFGWHALLLSPFAVGEPGTFAMLSLGLFGSYRFDGSPGGKRNPRIRRCWLSPGEVRSLHRLLQTRAAL